MSRSMRSEEYEPFEKKYGYHPSSFPVALDALAVYVNKDNPIECLTIEQLDQIFSKSHLYSGGKNVTYVGGGWTNRRMGGAPNFTLRTKFGFGHL